MSSEELAQAYLQSLEEIKLRLADVKRLASRAASPAAEPFDNDLVAVHFRKVTELITFGYLTANKKRYAEAYTDFAGHWKLKEVLNNLAKIHPNFYPRPVVVARQTDIGGRRHHHFDFVQRGFLTRSDLAKLYGQCSQAIHARNPFATKQAQDPAASPMYWISKIERLLSFHQMRFVDTRGMWIIEYAAPTDGQAHAYIGFPEDPAHR